MQWTIIYVHTLALVAGRDAYAHDEEGVRKSMVRLLLDREENQAHVRHYSMSVGHA